MVNFENSKKKKILISIFGTLVAFYSLAIGIILFIDSHSFLCLLFSVIISIGFFGLILTTCLCYFKYDDEKIICYIKHIKNVFILAIMKHIQSKNITI